MRVSLVLFVAWAALGVAGNALAQGSWTAKAPMPAPLVGQAAAELNGLIHMVGGGDSSA